MTSKPASVVARSAVILDHLAALVISSIFFVPSGIFFLRDGVSFSAVTLFSTVFTILVTFAYFVVFEYKKGATPAKKAFGLKVVTGDGEKISLWQAVVRNLLRAVDISTFYLTGFGMMLTNPENRRLGDIAARTIVVSKNEKDYITEEPNLGIVIVGYSLAIVGLFPMAGIFPAVITLLV